MQEKLLEKLKEMSKFFPADISTLGNHLCYILIDLKLFSGENLPSIELAKEKDKFFLRTSPFPGWLHLNNYREVNNYLIKKIKWLFPEIKIAVFRNTDTGNRVPNRVPYELRIETTSKNIHEKLLTLVNAIILIDGFLSGLKPDFKEFEITRKELIETIIYAINQGDAREVNIDQLKKELSKLSYEELVEELQKTAEKYCLFIQDGETFYDSMAFSAFRDILLLLSKLGKVQIVGFTGRRIIAVPVVE